jgi:cysteinyl-tRNA synthetase
MRMLKLYETRAREVLPIEGRDGALQVYCCGPTVYRDAHVTSAHFYFQTSSVEPLHFLD